MIARPNLPTSDRIRLRPLSPADLQAQIHGQDSDIVRWLSGKVNTEEEHREALEQAEHEWTRGAHKFDLGIELIQTGELAGMVGLQSRMPYLEPGQVNVTYALYAPYRGQGLASDAVRLAMGLGSGLFAVTEFVIRTHPENKHSAAVAHRLGYQLSKRTDDSDGVLDWYVAHAMPADH
jgi:RimJ/RimL family protein N-acetyltransferase